MQCPKCKFENENDAIYCTNCSERISSYIEEVKTEKEKYMFKHFFSFEGRIGRTEWNISFILLAIVAKIIISVSGELYLIFYVPLLWFLLAQGAKRCHDRNNSGWYQIIPFYGFWMSFAAGNFGNNKYGLDPNGNREEQLYCHKCGAIVKEANTECPCCGCLFDTDENNKNES